MALTLRPIGILEQRDQALGGPPPVIGVECRLEYGAEPVVIGLGNRVVAMVVTLGTAHRQTKQCRADDLERVGDDLIRRQRLVGRTQSMCRRRRCAEIRSRRATRLSLGVKSFQGRGTSSSPASCSTTNRSSGLSALIERTT